MATSTITHTVTDASGTALEGVPVLFILKPAGGFRTSTGSEVAKITRATTNSSGTVSVALERNADITPSGTYYEAQVLFPAGHGGTRKYLFQVGSSNQSLYAALITAPTAVTAATALTQAAGDARYVQSPGSFGATGVISTVTPGDSADGGSEATYARADHTHAHALHKFQVCTSATRPASPTKGDTIYETDTGQIMIYYGATTGWQREWDHPWGVMGNGYATSDQGSITNTEVNLTSMTTTFDAVADRYYQATISMLWLGTNTGDQLLCKVTDGSNTVIHQFYDNTVSTAAGSSRTWVTKPFTLSAGSQTVKLRAVRNSGTGTLTVQSGLAYPSGITVEDIGPAATVPSA